MLRKCPSASKLAGRQAWLFARSDRGGHCAAAMYSLIGTAKLDNVDPQAWLADVLHCIADHPVSRLDEFPPWHWKESFLKPLPRDPYRADLAGCLRIEMVGYAMSCCTPGLLAHSCAPLPACRVD